MKKAEGQSQGWQDAALLFLLDSSWQTPFSWVLDDRSELPSLWSLKSDWKRFRLSLLSIWRSLELSLAAWTFVIFSSNSVSSIWSTVQPTQKWGQQSECGAESHPGWHCCSQTSIFSDTETPELAVSVFSLCIYSLCDILTHAFALLTELFTKFHGQTGLERLNCLLGVSSTETEAK